MVSGQAVLKIEDRTRDANWLKKGSKAKAKRCLTGPAREGNYPYCLREIIRQGPEVAFKTTGRTRGPGTRVTIPRCPAYLSWKDR